MMAQKCKVIVADDFPILRQFIVEELMTMDRVEVVAQAKDGREVVELTRLLKPDLVLMDVRMPELDGLKATALIHEEFPSIQIICMSCYVDTLFSDLIQEIGALCIVQKEDVIEKLRNVLDRCQN